MPIDTSDSELGKTILVHLNDSKHLPVQDEIIKQYWKNLIKQAKHTSEKSFIAAAKRISITQEDNNSFKIEPFEAFLSQRVYYRIPEKIRQFSAKEIVTIAQEVRLAWKDCIIN